MSMSISEWKGLMASDDEFSRIEALDDPPVDSGRDVVELIIASLKDPSVLVRQSAAEALGSYEEPGVREALIDCIKTESEYLVREFAISSLGEIADLDDLKFLCDLAAEPNEDEVLIHTYSALMSAVNRIALGGLARVLQTEGHVAKSSAANAIRFVLTGLCSDVLRGAVRKELEQAADDVTAELKEVDRILACVGNRQNVPQPR